MDCQAVNALVGNAVNTVSRMKFATAIGCMDGRTQLPVTAKLKEKHRVNCVDMVTEADPVKILADCKDQALIN